MDYLLTCKKGESYPWEYISFSTPEALNDFVISSMDFIIIKEEWKDIPKFNGAYKISNIGRVKSYNRSKGKILTPAINKHGYLRIHLYDRDSTNKTDNKGNGRYLKNNRTVHMIHVLVGENFVHNPDPENFNELDHINRISDDPVFWNLRWIDRVGNMNNRRCTIVEDTEVDENLAEMF